MESRMRNSRPDLTPLRLTNLVPHHRRRGRTTFRGMREGGRRVDTSANPVLKDLATETAIRIETAIATTTAVAIDETADAGNASKRRAFRWLRFRQIVKR